MADCSIQPTVLPRAGSLPTSSHLDVMWPRQISEMGLAETAKEKQGFVAVKHSATTTFNDDVDVQNREETSVGVSSNGAVHFPFFETPDDIGSQGVEVSVQTESKSDSAHISLA